MTSNNQQTSNNKFRPHLMKQELLKDLRKKNLIGSDHKGERPFWGPIKIGDYNYFVPSTSGVEKVKYGEEKARWKIEEDKIVFKDLNESDGYLTIRSKDLDNNATNPDEIVLILDFNNMVCVPDKMFVKTYFSYDEQKRHYEDQTTYCLNSLTQEDFEVVLEKNTNSQKRLIELRDGFVQVNKGKKNINDAETAYSQYIVNEYRIERAKHQKEFIIDNKEWQEVVREKVKNMRTKNIGKYTNIEIESKKFLNSKKISADINKKSSSLKQPYNKENNFFSVLSKIYEGNNTLGGPMCNQDNNVYPKISFHQG
ncbi:MAG: hypothetical protein K5769_03640 [Pseudobutyrivibrio sp.]|nr:hypothetical protein [Pseudobutyrivibrio sp.]